MACLDAPNSIAVVVCWGQSVWEKTWHSVVTWTTGVATWSQVHSGDIGRVVLLLGGGVAFAWVFWKLAAWAEEFLEGRWRR